MRDDNRDGDRRPDASGGRDDNAGDPPSPRECIPDPEACNDERDLLLAGGRCDREQCERKQPVLVEVPERDQEKGGRECDGMELVQGQPAGRGIQEVGEREAESGARRAEVLAREEEDRDGAERDHECLRDEQQLWAGPEPPQWSEEHEDGIDVCCEPRDLIAVKVRHPQRVAVRGRPDGLHHVPEVEASGHEGVVTECGEGREAGGVCGNAGGKEHARARKEREALHRSRSMIFRQRSPSTASLA